MSHFRVVAAILATALSLPSPAQSQTGAAPGGQDQPSDVQFFGINIGIGVVTAGIGALAQGEPVGRAVMRGALGGSAMYAGKRMAVEEWPAAGLLGRQISSLGASVVSDAAAGRGWMERSALGFGPVRIYIRSGADAGVRWKVDAVGTIVVVGALAYPHLSLDFGRTLSSGAATFRAGQRSSWYSLSAPGVILYGPSWDPDRTRYVQAHEAVHVLQYDQSYVLWGEPVEAWLARRSGAARAVHRWIEFNFTGLSAAVIGSMLWDHEDRPWEVEATNLPR